MKTNRIAIALLASVALMLSSCDNREKDYEDITIGEGEVAFRIGEVKTRSAAINQSETVQLGTVRSEDSSFILEDEVTSLDSFSDDIATRGTPAFTENVKDLYGTFYTVALKAGGTDAGSAAFAKNTDLVNGVEYTYEKDNIWHYQYGEDIWANLPTYFFMRMPGSAPGVDLGTAPYNLSTGSITFNYTSPPAVANQKDILFTSYKRTEETNCEDITFFHALTGVKFSNYFDNKAREKAEGEDFDPKTTKTIIKKVTIHGLKNQGTCTVTPDFTKTSKDVVEWNNVTGNADFSITLGEAPNDTTNYTGSTYGLDTLLDANAKARNLNDKDGTLTFWFIPQDLTRAAGVDSVYLEVTFDVELDGKTTFSGVVVKANLSKLLTAEHRNWQAGQLHTFTLRPTKVGVDIDDKLDEYVKSDVVVENTGNVWQYVRVNMIGNWWGNLWKENDEQGNPVYYTDSTVLAGYAHASGDEETPGWNDKDGDEVYGHFVNLVAKSTTSNPVVNSHGWVRFDKYWYYTKPLGPGDSVSDTFFDSYTVGPSPEFWISDIFGTRHAAGNVHLIMDLMVQSIEAPMTEDGEEITDYMHAWAAALGFGDNVAALDDL